MTVLDSIMIAMRDIELRTGSACTFQVATYGDKPFQTYIASNDHSEPRYGLTNFIKHDTLEECLERFENYIKDSKGEVVAMLKDNILSLNNKLEAQHKRLKEFI